jgi:hypothetical protein
VIASSGYSPLGVQMFLTCVASRRNTGAAADRRGTLA